MKSTTILIFLERREFLKAIRLNPNSANAILILEEDAVAGDHSLVERQSRLGAVPLNEFIDRVSISPLRLGRAKAI